MSSESAKEKNVAAQAIVMKIAVLGIVRIAVARLTMECIHRARFSSAFDSATPAIRQILFGLLAGKLSAGCRQYCCDCGRNGLDFKKKQHRERCFAYCPPVDNCADQHHRRRV
jgi:hypothetical protein